MDFGITLANDFVRQLSVCECSAPKVLQVYRVPKEHWDEVLSDAASRAWRGFVRFEQRSSFQTWYVKILKRCILDFFSRQARHKTVPIPGELSLADSDFSDPFDRQVVVMVDLCAAMSELPAKERAALSLVYIDQFSYAEAAEALMMSEKEFRNYLRRGLTHMKERLSSYED